MKAMTEFKTTDYKCKLCGLEGKASFSVECDEEWFNQLYPALACNRCADYRTACNTIKGTIRETAINLIAARLNANVSEEHRKVLPDREKRARRLFSMLTRQLSSTVCKFHHLTDNYLEEFSDILMEKPKFQHQILETFMAEQMKRVHL